MPRKQSNEGPRAIRLPEPKYHEEEAAEIREAAGYSISDFIRRSAVNEARRILKELPRAKKSK